MKWQFPDVPIDLIWFNEGSDPMYIGSKMKVAN